MDDQLTDPQGRSGADDQAQIAAPGERGWEGSVIPGDLVEAALDCAPQPQADAVSVPVEGGVLLWGQNSQVMLLTFASAAVWPFLDGRTTLRDLVEDLAAVSPGVPRATIEQRVAGMALDLAVNGLLDGMQPALDLHPQLTEPVREEGTREEVRDGVRYITTEFVVAKKDIRRITGGHASPAELVPPDSCTGKRIHLDREGEIVSLQVGDQPLAVRSGDHEVTEWLRARATPTDVRGALVAFVTTDDAAGRDRRFGVYDHDALLATSTTDRSMVYEAVAALLVNHVELEAPPESEALRAHILVRDGRAVIAPVGALLRPRGIERRLAGAGVRPLPGRRAYLSWDGHRVYVPRMTDLPDVASIVWDEYPVQGAWARGNRPGAALEAHKAIVIMRDSPPLSAEHRRRLIEATAAVVRHHPVALTFNTMSATSEVADQVLSVFDA